MEEDQNIKKISRREFFYWLIPVAGSSVILLAFMSIYANFLNKGKLAKTSFNLFRTHPKKKKKVKRKQWTNELLILNTNTHIVHYPTKRVYTYYDEIDAKHIAKIDFDLWESKITGINHFNKGKSGIILETLALKKLKYPFDNDSLEKATNALSIAFNTQYYKYNTSNLRLYNLLIQLIAMNTSIPHQDAVDKFHSIIKLVDFKFVKIPKSHLWLISNNQTDKNSKINEKLTYIYNNIEKYKKKLKDRIS